MPIFAPVNVFGSWTHIDSSNDVKLLPIIESDEIFALDSQESTSVDSLILEISFECLVFAEILENLYSAIIILDSVNVL